MWRLAETTTAMKSQLRYLLRRRPWPIEYPTVVQFPVNDICDSKCQMCNIWQQKRDREITPEQVRDLFGSHLFRRVRTVGLNGGEPTLRRDLASIARNLIESLPRLQTLSLITNGLHSERATARIDELAEVATERGVRLDVMVSLDGVAHVHDRVRGVEGNFEQAVRVLDHLLARADRYAVRVGCTVVRDNVYDLHELLDFCLRRNVYCKFRLGVPNRRLYNLQPTLPRTIGKRSWLDTHPFDLDIEQRWHFAQFLQGLVAEYEPALAQRQFYRSLAEQVLRGAPRGAGCDWQHRGVTVSSRGELMYCAVQSEVLGDAITTDPQRLYFEGEPYLQSIVETKCSGCAHDYVGPPGGIQQAQLLLGRILGDGRPGVMARRSMALGRVFKRRILSPMRFTCSRLGHARRARREVILGEPRFDALICGWYGTETLGDKAILAGIVSTIRAATPDARIAIASLDAVYTRLNVLQMPELARCEVVDATSMHAWLGQCRVLVFGGGPLMAIREMASMEAVFRQANAAGIPTVVAGCGVGPLGNRAFNRSIASLLISADHRIFRDQASRELAARRLSVPTEDDVVTDDPAATWVRAIREPMPGSHKSRVLALGLRDWPYRQYAPAHSDARGEEIKGRVERCIIDALEALVDADPSLRILPIPFCTHQAGGDDRWLYWRLLRKSAALHRVTDRSLLSRELAPAEYLKHLGGARAILTMRFHSLVFAATLGVPAVAIDYTSGLGKTHALGRHVGCPTIPIERCDPGELASALRQALESTGRPAVSTGSFSEAFTRVWLDCLNRSRQRRTIPV